MTVRLMLALLASIYATSGFGKPMDEFMTPAGLVKAADDKVTVAGKVVYTDGSVALHEFGEVGILIEGHHGGKHCPNSYHILNPATGKLRILFPENDRSTLFGECLRLIAVLPDVELVILGPSQPEEQATIYAWNGKTMIETILKRSNSGAGIPGGGDAVRRWKDKYLFELLGDPDERTRLLSVLSEEELKWFGYAVMRGSPMHEKDGFVVGHGCEPDMCNANWAVLALRISDGAPFVLMPDGFERLPKGQKMPAVIREEAKSMH